MPDPNSKNKLPQTDSEGNEIRERNELPLRHRTIRDIENEALAVERLRITTAAIERVQRDIAIREAEAIERVQREITRRERRAQLERDLRKREQAPNQDVRGVDNEEQSLASSLRVSNETLRHLQGYTINDLIQMHRNRATNQATTEEELLAQYAAQGLHITWGPRRTTARQEIDRQVEPLAPPLTHVTVTEASPAQLEQVDRNNNDNGNIPTRSQTAVERHIERMRRGREERDKNNSGKTK